jgi:predicted acyl esterase
VELAAGEPTKLTLRLFDVAYRFSKGSRIRLYLTNGDCYSFENPLTGEPSNAQTHWASAEVTIPATTARPSKLVLPTLP